ncbi:hypothetical protein B0H11DRAFT_867565 [Mycena galericulata]|nr:hypothetical protein B0H11DRAFT_867565 [Mycena galericulata]
MPGILTLPTELIQDIYSQAQWKDKKHLRATCRALNSSLGPLLLSHLEIDHTTGVEQLELLATPSYQGSSFVKSVTIRASQGFREVFIATFSSITGLLVPALSALKNVKSVQWDLDSCVPADVLASLIEGLNSLPRVAVLKLAFPDSGDIPLALSFDRFRDLRSICIVIPAYNPGWRHIVERIVQPLGQVIANNPALKHLEVERLRSYDYSWSEDSPADDKTAYLSHLLVQVDSQRPLKLHTLKLTDDVTHLDKHIRAQLTSLSKLYIKIPSKHMIFPNEGDEGRQYAPDERTSAMWRDLAAEHIFPPAFSTSAPTDGDILQYLAAHPGIARLEFTGIESLYHPRCFDVHADVFYAEVLPRHSATLTHLFINAGREGRWVFGPHNAVAILQCCALVELRMAIDYEYRVTRSNQPRKTEKTRVDNTWLLLDIAFELPRLQTLFITLADWYIEPNGRMCGTGRIRRWRSWLAHTKGAVEPYRITAERAKRMPFRLSLMNDDRIVYLIRHSGDTDGSFQFYEVGTEPVALEPWYAQVPAVASPGTRWTRIQDLKL